MEDIRCVIEFYYPSYIKPADLSNVKVNTETNNIIDLLLRTLEVAFAGQFRH